MSKQHEQTDLILPTGTPLPVSLQRTTPPSRALGRSQRRQEDELDLQMAAEEGTATKTALGMLLVNDLYDGMHALYLEGVDQMFDRAEEGHNARATRIIDAATEQLAKQRFRDMNAVLVTGVQGIEAIVARPLTTTVEAPRRRLLGLLPED